MPSRRAAIFLVALLACALPGATTARAQMPAKPAGKTTPVAPGVVMTPIEFYLAHGEANACGPGCSDWIAAEGKIDVGAVDRFRQLLKTLKDRRPPIYLHSPGGRLNETIEIGRLIREKKFEVSVGYTVPLGCSNDKQSDNSCETQKRAGKAIEAEISPILAQCNSACVYLLAAGITHPVPPGVKLGIHDAGLDPSVSLPRGASLAPGLRIIHGRMRGYLHEMGIDDGMYAASLATPFESLKLLERDDIVRFGIDRREFGETTWQFTDKPVWQIAKRFFLRIDGDPAHYIDGSINVVCNGSGGINFALSRPQLASDTPYSGTSLPAARIAINGQPVGLKGLSQSAGFYVRFGPVNALDKVGDDTTIDLPGVELARKELGDVTLHMDGFSAAYAKLKPHCFGSPSARQAADAWLMQQSQEWLKRPLAKPTPLPGVIVGELPSSKPAMPPTLELTRVAAAEQKLRMEFFYALQYNCTSVGKSTVVVLEQPRHGAVSIENGKAYTDFPQGDPRSACNAFPADGTLVFYQPNADYHGADSMTLSVLVPAAGATTRHYSIDVK